jgi:hypothetical protein
VSLQALAIAWAVQAALALALGGLLARGQWKQSRAFVVYLATVLVAESTVIFWPARFWTFDWYIARQVSYSTLKLAVAGLLATFALVVLLQPGGEADHTLVELLLARLANGAIWLFVGLAAVARWYVIPLHPLHKAILTGYSLFGVLSVASLRFAHLNEAVTAAMPFAYLLLVSYWVFAAWTVRDPVDAPALDAMLARAR